MYGFKGVICTAGGEDGMAFSKSPASFNLKLEEANVAIYMCSTKALSLEDILSVCLCRSLHIPLLKSPSYSNTISTSQTKIDTNKMCQHVYFNYPLGIVSTQGNTWREQRKFAHSIFREMGVGTTLMEEKITVSPLE